MKNTERISSQNISIIMHLIARWNEHLRASESYHSLVRPTLCKKNSCLKKASLLTSGYRENNVTINPHNCTDAVNYTGKTPYKYVSEREL